MRLSLVPLIWFGLAIAVASSFLTSLSAESEINGGDLVFLAHPPAGHHLYQQKNHVTVTPSSLKTGWVISRQCHYQLDQVRAMQVVFGKGRVRKLKVIDAQNIGRIWIENDTVQMKDVGTNASFCIESENKSLRRDGEHGNYLLASGPYMRRFLDGYFPIQLDLRVDYPSNLRLDTITPADLQSRTVAEREHVKINALFEGRLIVSLGFSRRTPASPGH